MTHSLELLITYIKEQDKRAERLLFDTFYLLVYRIAYSITKEENAAEDIVQETFIKIFSKLDHLKEPEKIEPWVKTIARRTAYDKLRKQKKWNETPWEDVYNQEGFEVETLYEEKEIQGIVADVIENLEPMPREILRLKLLEGLTDEEIAFELSIKVGTVKSRIHRAKEKLKEKLTKGGMYDDPTE